MDGWNFIITAEKLRDTGDEWDHRSSISRSYYAALNAVLCVLDRQGVKVKREGTHNLCQWLRGCAIAQLRQAGKKLDDLKAMRIDADYRMDLPPSDFSPAQTQVAFREAKRARQLYRSVPAKLAADVVVEYLRATNQLHLVTQRNLGG